MTTTSPSERTRVRRVPDRGVYDRETIDQILDEALIAHVGFEVDGAPAVIPTAFWRTKDRFYFHGSSTSRMVRVLRDGVPCCVCVTLLDGIVLARSAFHHSMNYRSVVIYGRATELSEPDRKQAALEAFTEKLAPGRWRGIRLPTPQELNATAVMSLPIDEASAKVRSGPPVDEEADYALPVWAGVVPLRMAAAEPVPDPRLPPSVPIPEHARHFMRRSTPSND